MASSPVSTTRTEIPSSPCMVASPLQLSLSSQSSNSDHCLKLSEKVVHFDPVSKDTAVFFDDVQCQIFVVRENGSAGVKVRSPFGTRRYDLFFEDKGPVFSIKFSPDFTVLGVQRSTRSVEFLNILDSSSVDLGEYSQMCRARSARILGFCWVSNTEVVLITDSQGLESYQVKPEQKTLKSLKNYSLPVSWFLFTPPYLLLASGTNCNIFHIFVVKSGGGYQRYPKFEVDSNGTTKIHERDVALVPIYGSLYILFIKQVSKLSAGAEIVLYQINREGSAKISDILLLECNGRFAINVSDNLIIVHHQQSKISKVFDIKLNQRNDGIRHHFSLSSFPIAPYNVKMHGVSIPYELYSSNWAVFLPGIIVDAKLGYLWYIELDCNQLAYKIADKVKRIEFFLLRDISCKSALLEHLNSYVNQPEDFPVTLKCFDLINARLKSDVRNRTAFPEIREVYQHLLLPLSRKEFRSSYVVAVMIEYFRSLISNISVEPPYYLCELLVNILVQFQMFPVLRQLIENRVFADSKPFACLLLSLDSVFPPAFQMALDMLKRIGGSSEERAEILLARYEIFPAIKLLLSTGIFSENQLPARKFLEPALQSGDHTLFYSVFRYFQQRNLRTRYSASFLDSELCDDIVAEFESLFPEDNSSFCDFSF